MHRIQCWHMKILIQDVRTTWRKIPSCPPIGLKLENLLPCICQKLRNPPAPIQTCAKVHVLGITIPELQMYITPSPNLEHKQPRTIMALDGVHATASNCSLLIPAYMHQKPCPKSHKRLDRFPPSSNSN